MYNYFIRTGAGWRKVVCIKNVIYMHGILLQRCFIFLFIIDVFSTVTSLIQELRSTKWRVNVEKIKPLNCRCKMHFRWAHNAWGCLASGLIWDVVPVCLSRTMAGVPDHSCAVHIPPICMSWAGIFKQSMEARNRGGIVLSYWPATLQAGGIHSLESIPGFHKRLKIRARNAKESTRRAGAKDYVA